MNSTITRRIISIGFAAALACTSPPTIAEHIDAPSAANWPYLGNNLAHWGYSPTDQINQSTVSSMGLLWHSDLPIIDGLVGNPLVRDGVVYQSAPGGVVFANDVATGKLIWTFKPSVNLSHTSLVGMVGAAWNRGLAIDQRNVYVTGAGCHLYAVNRRTGKEVWHTEFCKPTSDYGSEGPVHIGKGIVFVGATDLELGTERGFLDAFDAATGKRLWRFYTVPGNPARPQQTKAMAMAAKTWGRGWWKYTHGGAVPWDGGVYDPKTGLYLFGTGDVDIPEHQSGWMPPRYFPAQPPGERKALATGDWLFGSSIVAVDARTGKYVWHFQEVAHDRWADDAANPLVIADLPIAGRDRHIVMQAAKDGYFYVLDAATGKCISAGNYAPDPKFLPINRRTCKLTAPAKSRYWLHPHRPFLMQPADWGSHGWQAMAYDPTTHLVYIPAFISSRMLNGSYRRYGYEKTDKYHAHGELIAWDPIIQKEAWHVDYPIVQNGGVLATKGNLVFQGTPDGRFIAYSAETGKVLWTYDTKSVILGEPSAVMSNGREIVLVPVGDGGAAVGSGADPILTSTPQTLAPSRLLAFGIGGKEVLPDTPLKLLPRPARPPQPASLAAIGARLFASNYCSLCHSPDLVHGGGHIPDLRAAPESILELMPDILRKGSLQQGGMPRFKYFTDADVRALRAYIINQAWKGYEWQQAHTKIPCKQIVTEGDRVGRLAIYSDWKCF